MTDTADQLLRARSILSDAGVSLSPDVVLKPRGPYACPDLSGIASSFNPYAWNEYIEPESGVARLAFGLASRFQDRSGDDFTRLVPLGAPNRRPESGPEDVARYSQRRVDVQNAETGRTETVYFADLPDVRLPLLTSEHRTEESAFPILTFERLLAGTRFVSTLRDILTTLRDRLGHDVVIEFSGDIQPDERCRFCLLSCQPFPELPDAGTAPGLRCFESTGAVIGTSRRVRLGRIVYVPAAVYSTLPTTDRYEIARLIGRINRATEPKRALLLGPGRWCTSSPELGIPADVSEIDRAAAIGEVVAMRKGLVPEVSRGSHLLNELVAMDILYLAIFPGIAHTAFDEALLDRLPNRLTDVVPGSGHWRDAVRVIDVPGGVDVAADVRRQNAVGTLLNQ